jgi:hypothetical protein
MSNPWYEVVGSDVRLTQGDIIVECPLLKWQLDDAAEGKRASAERLFNAAKGVKADVVVTAIGDIAIYRQGIGKLRNRLLSGRTLSYCPVD